jgi:tetratricopeptide (TPR) repeat protein
VGGPETEGLGFEELTERGKEASTRGATWEAYGCLRDATSVAFTSELQERFKDALEQSLCAIMNYTIVVSQLGRHVLSLHELEFVRSTNALGLRCSTILLELLSQKNRTLGDFRRARALSDQAVHNADLLGSTLYRAHTYADRANLECRDRNFDEAISWYKQAHSLFQRAGLPSGAARALQNLAQTYFDAGRIKASKRALLAAERLAAKHGFGRARAMVRILSGEIAVGEGDPDKAVRLWREAVDIAKQLRDPIIRFKAEFQLYRHAVEEGDTVSESSLKRLLQRRATWVPDTLDELAEFKKLTA